MRGSEATDIGPCQTTLAGSDTALAEASRTRSPSRSVRPVFVA
jgi:hypothetical protein